MTITFPIVIPIDFVDQATFREVNLTGFNDSIFTGSREKQAYEGGWWTVDVRWAELSAVEGEDLGAILSALRGAEGTCTLIDFLNRAPRGEAATNPGTPSVNGAGQFGYTVDIKGGPSSVTNWLLRGSRIQIGPDTRPRLYKVLTDVSTDIAGEATIDIWPALKSPVLDSDPVVLTNPKLLLEMVENDMSFDIRAPELYRYRMQFRESF